MHADIKGSITIMVCDTITSIIAVCDEWGGPRAVGTERGRWSKWWWATPAPLTGLHHSPVPRRSSGRIKGGATTAKDERTMPGLLLVCGSRPWGAAAFLLCLFIFLHLKLLNVKNYSAPPHSSVISAFMYMFSHSNMKKSTLLDISNLIMHFLIQH